jgi:MFS-type transporter involved in bile tolerance (Atg22 family)
MDHGGAAIGTLLGAGILWLLGVTPTQAASGAQLRTVFLWASVPGILALVALALTPEPSATRLRLSAKEASPGLPAALKRALLPLVLFALANATDAFILVKATRMGASPLMAPLLWLALHLVKATTATTGGRLADGYGKRNALALGWTVYAITWSLVGFSETIAQLFMLTAIYGTSHGLVEGAEKALIAELAEGRGRGKAFGAYNMLIGITALVASTTFGLVWDTLGDIIAFMGSGAFALLAAMLLLARVPGR